MTAQPSVVPDRERGQILIIFAVALVAVVAMVGLVLDGGSAMAQRRSQQNASDLAALAGANVYLLTSDQSAARAAALEVSAQNGWDEAEPDVDVTVSFDTTNGVEVTVDIDAPHYNNFGSIMNMSTWDVGTTATALSGIPDTAEGAGPFIFSVEAFGTNGLPLPQYGDPDNPFDFGDTNNDAPDHAGDFAWTNYGTGNVDTNTVRRLIDGRLVITKTIDFGDYIGQHNNGFHTALFNDVNDHLSGQDVPVPVVDVNGNFQGWATFRVISASGGSDKHIRGYFVTPWVSQRLTVGGCSVNDCPRFFGNWTLKLVN